jgi:hypothetical protein
MEKRNESILISRPKLSSSGDIAELTKLRRESESNIGLIDYVLTEDITVSDEKELSTKQSVVNIAKSFVNEKNRLAFVAMVLAFAAFVIWLGAEGKITLPSLSW